MVLFFCLGFGRHLLFGGILFFILYMYVLVVLGFELGLALDKQVHYHLSHASSYLGIFWRWDVSRTVWP
jgi:hypothetical protein